MGKAYIGETVLVQEEQIINNAPTKVLTLNEDDEITVSDFRESVDKNKEKDLPELPFISCTYKGSTGGYGRYMTYYTDTIREIDLLQYIPDASELYALFGVIKRGNRVIFKVEKDDAFGNMGLLALDMVQVGNEYIIKNHQYKELPSLGRDVNNFPYNLHSQGIIDGFLYLASRTTTTTGGAYEDVFTQMFKVNIYDINDVEEYSLPEKRGAVGELQVYKDKIYMIARKSASDAYMISIDKDFKNYHALFPLGNVSSQKRIPVTPPFVIYEDKFYISTLYNSSSPTNGPYNLVGVAVYSVQTNQLLQENPAIEISTGRTAGQGSAHWMSMYGGKLFMTVVSPSPTNDTRLVRIDPYTLLLDGDIGEASITLPYKITNNNTITLDGLVYPNPESTFTAPLKRYKWNNFLEEETLIETGYYSGGSLEYPVNPERLKNNLSDYNNDTNFVNSTQLATKQDQLIAGSNITLTDNGDGTTTIDASGGGGGGATNLSYTPSPTDGTVNSDTGTDAIIQLADSTNAGLMPANFYVVYPETTYTETVTWGGTAPTTMQNSTWQATKIGNRLSLRMNISYATAGTGNTTAQVPLPTGVPLPSSITGFTNNNSYMAVGSAAVSTGITSNPTISRAVLRRETGTTYSVYNTFSSGAYNTIIIDIEYFTD